MPFPLPSFPMLSFVFFFALYLTCVVVAQGNNITIDDLDQSVVFQPIQAWKWSAQGVGTFQGTFSFSEEPNATVVFNFPGKYSLVV